MDLGKCLSGSTKLEKVAHIDCVACCVNPCRKVSVGFHKDYKNTVALVDLRSVLCQTVDLGKCLSGIIQLEKIALKDYRAFCVVSK